MATAGGPTLLGLPTTRIRIQSIDVEPTTRSKHNIGLKLLLSGRVHERIEPLPNNPLHWDNVTRTPMDAKPADSIELRIYEYHMLARVRHRKIRIGTVVFQADQANQSPTGLTVVDHAGLVPCSVRFTFSPPQPITSIQHSMHQLAAAPIIVDSRVQKRMRKVFDMVGRVGQQVSELNPVVNATLEICNTAWQTLGKQHECDELVRELVSGMGNLLPMIGDIDDQANIEPLRAVIVQILWLVEDASRFVINYKSDGAVVRAVRPFICSTAQEQVDGFLQQLKGLKSDFDTGIAVQTNLTIQAVLMNADQDRLKELITPDSGHNPSSGCLQGTRTAVQSDICQWVLHSSNTSRSMYWLAGLAGCGKTTITHSICASLDSLGCLAASFFCKWDKEKLSRPENVISTLAASLAFKCPQYGEALVRAIHKNPLITTAALVVRFQSMIMDVIQSMNSAALPNVLVLVIDALDECGTIETRTQLASYLVRLAQLVPWLKIIVTSRSNYQLEHSIRKGDNLVYRNLSNEDQSVVASDIELLIRPRLEEIITDDETLSHVCWLQDGTVSRLTAQANGLFIWAQTVCRVISSSLDPGETIRHLLSESRESVPGAMTQLHSLYSRVLREALDSVVGREGIIKSCIAAIVIARAPLADTDLARLFPRIKLIEFQRVIRQLGSVVHRDNHGAIRLLHQSFSDYMRHEECPTHYRINKAHQNMAFAVSCLGIMITELKFNICQLTDSCLLNCEVVDLADRIQKYLPRYLRYSCLYWLDHLMTARECAIAPGECQSSLENLGKFLNEPCALYWVEVMSLLDELRKCEEALTVLKTRIWNKAPGLQKCAEELCWLVTNFYLPISQSTPHLYVSALALGCESWDQLDKLQDVYPNRVKIVQGGHLAKFSNQWSRVINIPHPAPVTAVSYSPDGSFLTTACDDGKVRVFNALTGASQLHLSHEMTVAAIAVSPNNQRIVSGSSDGKVRVWNTNTSTLAFDPLIGHIAPVTCVAFSPSGQRLASGSEDRTVVIWDMSDSPGMLLSLTHRYPLRCIAVSPDGARLQLASGSDKIVRLWDTSGDLCEKPVLLEGHDHFVSSVAFSPDGKHIASGSYDRTVRIWDRSSCKCSRVISLPNPRDLDPVSIAFSPNSRRIASGASWGGGVRVYDIAKGTLVCDPFDGHSGWVNSVAFSPGGGFIASGSSDGSVLLWEEPNHLKGYNSLQSHSRTVNAIACSPDGQLIATGSKDMMVKIWDARTGALLHTSLHGDSSWDFVTHNAFVLASVSRCKTLQVWNAWDGNAIHDSFRHAGPVEDVAFSPNDRLILSSDSYRVLLWDLESGAFFFRWDHIDHSLLGRTIPRIIFPENNYVLSASFDTRPVVLMRRDGQNRSELPSVRRQIDLMCAALSPDGRFSAGLLFNRPHPQPGAQISVHGFSGLSLALWDNIDPGEDANKPFCNFKLEGWVRPEDRDEIILPGMLLSAVQTTASELRESSIIVFSSDSQKIALHSTRRGTHVGDIGSHHGVLTPIDSTYPSPCRTIAFSHDGQHIISGHENGDVRVWVVPSPPGSEQTNKHPHVHENTWGPRVPSCQLNPQLNSAGWVVHSTGKRMLWLPYIYRRDSDYAYHMAMSKNLSDHPVVFDFTKFKYGDEWASIRVSSLTNT